MEGIIEEVDDDDGVTMLVPEMIEEVFGYGGYSRRRFPFVALAFPFIFPFPYYY